MLYSRTAAVNVVRQFLRATQLHESAVNGCDVPDHVVNYRQF